MLRLAEILLTSILVAGSLTVARAQEDSATASHTKELKTIVVAPEAKSDTVIAVPPATSVRGLGRDERKAAGPDFVDLTTWLRKEGALNGLQSTELRPWHIVVTYDQFDEDGDNVNSGVYEEFWAGPRKYRRNYKSDKFNQTDYATDKGLFRGGDQRWPNRTESQVRAEVTEPFYYGATLQGQGVPAGSAERTFSKSVAAVGGFGAVRARSTERTFSGYTLQCVLIEKESQIVSDPTQYCFEPDGSVLRYSRGIGWNQTVYNQIVKFQGRNIAQEVDVTAAGKPYLKLRVETIKLISHVDEVDFMPPPAAIGPFGERISGVKPSLIMLSFPAWPTSLRGQHFSVGMEIVIGKDGHVVSAHPVSGPQEGFKACEDAVRQWVYQPYLVLDKPVEVETKVECRH